MAEQYSPIITYTHELDALREQQLKQSKALRDRILGDVSLSDVDRAILGLTGSRSLLTKYRAFASEIHHSAGETILVPRQSAFHGGRAVHAESLAVAGVLTGNLQVKPRRIGDDYSKGINIGVGVSIGSEVVSDQSVYPPSALYVATIKHDACPLDYEIDDQVDRVVIGAARISQEIDRREELQTDDVREALATLEENIAAQSRLRDDRDFSFMEI